MREEGAEESLAIILTFLKNKSIISRVASPYSGRATFT